MLQRQVYTNNNKYHHSLHVLMARQQFACFYSWHLLPFVHIIQIMHLLEENVKCTEKRKTSSLLLANIFCNKTTLGQSNVYTVINISHHALSKIYDVMGLMWLPIYQFSIVYFSFLWTFCLSWKSVIDNYSQAGVHSLFLTKLQVSKTQYLETSLQCSAGLSMS